MVYLLFNPLANNGSGEKAKNEAKTLLEEKFGSESEEISILDVDYKAFLKKLKKDDKVILFGGDGTLMKFVNAIKGEKLPCKFYLYKAGTGNDFIKDVIMDVVDNVVELNQYLENLPTVYVNDKEYLYLNGIGYGLDGTACEIADKQRAEGKEKINYSSISINLLLFKFKCPSADVTVDGVTKHYKKVWLASGMNGKYYGGGMRIAPKQDRLSDKLTSVVFHDSGRLHTLLVFPKIFKGEHVKYTKMVDI